MANKYKFANPEHTFVNDLEKGMFGIHPQVHLWAEVLAYVDGGGVIEDFETPEEKMEKALKETEQTLSQEKKAIKTQGLLVNGILFDTDDAARIAYIELFLKFMTSPEYVVNDWKASEGQWVVMDYALFGQIMNAWEQQLSSLFTFIKQKETELKSKTSADDLKAIDTKFKN